MPRFYQPQPVSSRPSPPIRAVRVSSAVCPVQSVALVRPLVRSAGCMALQSECAAASSSSSSSSLSTVYRVYASDEDDSGDECSVSAALSHLPSYASVYSTIRQAATHHAQQQKDRQMERTHMSAVWEQHKRAANVEQQPAAVAARRPLQLAATASASPALRSTLSTASESSQLSAYSSDASSGCDTDTAASYKHSLSRSSSRHQPPQHFTFSVDDIDKALTEEELDQWFSNDADHGEDERSDEDELQRQRHTPQQRRERPPHATLNELPVHSPYSVASSASFSSSSSPSPSSVQYKPRLLIDTVACGDSDSESTIAVLPPAAEQPPVRRFKRSSAPSTFTFSRSDVRKSNDTPSEELNVGHWSTFPRPGVAVCDVRALRGRLREKKDEWDTQAATEHAEQQPQQAEEKKAGEPLRRPAAARRLFVEPTGNAAVRARQSVVMWRRDSHAQVAPLPAPLPPPAQSPHNAARVRQQQQQPTAHAQHRRASTAYSYNHNVQPAQHRAHYHSSALPQHHQLYAQQHSTHSAAAAYAQPTSRPAQLQQPHQLPPHTGQHASNARSDPSSLASSPGRHNSYGVSRMAHVAQTPLYTHQPHAHAPSQHPSLLAASFQHSVAAHAADLFSPRTGIKHNQWRAASYQSLHPYAAHSTQLMMQQQPSTHAHAAYHAYHSGARPTSFYPTADYYAHYAHFVHDALHALKPSAASAAVYQQHQHATPHDVWLNQTHQHAHQQLASSALTLERCVSAMPAAGAHQCQPQPPLQPPCPAQLHSVAQQAEWSHAAPSLPAAAHHSRGISAPQRC